MDKRARELEARASREWGYGWSTLSATQRDAFRAEAILNHLRQQAAPEYAKAVELVDALCEAMLEAQRNA